MTPLRPTSDLGFRKIFGSMEHREVIAAFLKDMFGIIVDPKDIRIRNPYTFQSYAHPSKEKGSQLLSRERDITLTVIDAPNVTIELQLANHEAFLERVLLYLTDLYSSTYAGDMEPYPTP